MTLEKVGLKVTTARLKILDLLEKNNQHLSAEDIYRKLLDQGDDIALATVYRVLTQFELANLVIRHRFGEERSVFELDNGEHHDHLVCIQCEKIVEFVDETIEERQRKIAQKHGFQITEHELYLYGICSDCQ